MNSWIKYATGEGVLKIIHFAIYKSFGSIAALLPFQLLVIAVIGVVEMIVAGGIAYVRSYAFVPNYRAVFGAIGFGLIAIWLTVVPIYALAQPSASLALFGFMTALSVLPGALFDRYAFGDRLRVVHWAGITLFLIGAWSIQDFPSLAVLLTAPVWVLLAYSFPIAAALNEFLARYAGISDLKPSVTTFWVGATQFAVCGALLLVGLGGSLQSVLSEINSQMWLTMIALGVLIWLGHLAKQMAYAPGSGGTIVMKKIVMIGVLMIGVFAYDAFVLNLQPTVGEWIGFGVFLLAMWLVYRE